MTQAPRPVSTGKRIQELDVFRGFAILGIFMVNILVMNVSFAYRGEWEAEQTGWLQSASFFVLETLFYSKFFVIFSLLFGMGVALQMERMRQNNNYSAVFFARRFTSLFILGAFHILFIWSGDILHLYGMLGFVLMLFFKANARVLLWSSVIIFFFPFSFYLFEEFVTWIGLDYQTPLSAFSRAALLDLKHNGSYYSGIILRTKEYLYAMGLMYAGIGPVALSMMLFGGYLIKKGVFNQKKEWLQTVKVPLLISFVLLIAYRFTLLHAILPNYEFEFGSPISIFLYTFFQLSDIALSLFYLWLIAFLWDRLNVQKLLSPLAYVGRMALTNYLMQSVLGYLIMRTFNGYEYFSALGCILLVLAIYMVQIVYSKQWLKHYQFGPMEWLWRCISYWKIVPIKKETVI